MSRTSPNQVIPTRPSRFKRPKQTATRFAINGRSPEAQLAGYVTREFPNVPIRVRKLMVAWMLHHDVVPNASELKNLFGISDDPCNRDNERRDYNR